MSDRHDLWQRAAAFAARAHEHQVRKDGKTPYVSHPFRVAMTIRHIFNCDDEIIIAAALLHDVIEDTGADYDDLAEAFGEEVADLVALMSKDMRQVEHEREVAYDEQLKSGSWKAKLIKLADVYDNLSDAGPRGGSVRSFIKKAERAIDLADDCPELEEPRRLLRGLADRALERMGALPANRPA